MTLCLGHNVCQSWRIRCFCCCLCVQLSLWHVKFCRRKFFYSFFSFRVLNIHTVCIAYWSQYSFLVKYIVSNVVRVSCDCVAVKCGCTWIWYVKVCVEMENENRRGEMIEIVLKIPIHSVFPLALNWKRPNWIVFHVKLMNQL